MSSLRYQSIESWTDEKHLAKVKERYGEDEYIAMEKIHGSNFHFMINEITVKCAKRTAYLEDNEQFYDWQDIRNRYLDDIMKLHKIFNSENNSLECVRVYGELFGGNYPKELLGKEHEEFKSKSVQRGIYYSPIIDFLVFDIVLTYKNSDSIILPHDEVLRHMLQMDKLKAVPIKIRGTFTEVYEYCKNNVQFKSTIPSFLGYNDHNLDTNYAEGYVMKPNKIVKLGVLRGILKIKHPKFDEMIGYDKNKKKKEPDEKRGHLFEEFECYITQNRLDNVISHYGVNNPKPYLIGRLIDDAKKSYMKTFEDDSEKTKEFEKEWKSLFKMLAPQCNKLKFGPDVA